MGIQIGGRGRLGEHKGDLDFSDTRTWDAPVWIDLDVDTGTYVMKFDEKNPINLVLGATCPTQDGVQTGEFLLLRAKEHKLTLLDLNQTLGSYSYTLRFKSEQSETGAFLLDPEIRNGGGGTSVDA